MKRQIQRTTYRALHWAQNHVAPGLRSVLGVLLMVGGVFGFLPVLGFWMFPLGIAFVALDLPLSRHRVDAWMIRLAREAGLELTPVPAAASAATVSTAPNSKPADQPTSSQ